jgi:hypothetical protein
VQDRGSGLLKDKGCTGRDRDKGMVGGGLYSCTGQGLCMTSNKVGVEGVFLLLHSSSHTLRRWGGGCLVLWFVVGGVSISLYKVIPFGYPSCRSLRV